MKPCPDCNGSGHAPCPYCDGRGYIGDPGDLVTIHPRCFDCAGQGYVDHPCDRCDGWGEVELSDLEREELGGQLSLLAGGTP